MLNNSLVRYVFVGGLIFLLDTAIFMMLFTLGTPSYMANVVAMTCGFAAGLVAHHRITFRQRRPLDGHTAIRYALCFVFNLVLATGVLEALLFLEVLPLISKLVATTVAVISNYLLARFIVFKP